jgi:LysR family glycine cleavage system transcriptional activator
LNALRAFEAAARHLNFSRAADELSVTPGAVSQQIQNLEDYVGAALFKRTPKGLLLTDAAQTALPALREAFDRLAEAASLLTAAVDGRRLTLTAAPSFAAKWLVPRLGKFEQAQPQVDVWLSAGMEVVDFAAGEVDLAIRYGSGRYPGLEVIRLLSETVIPSPQPELLAEPTPWNRPRICRTTSCCTTARPTPTTAARTGPCGWRRGASSRSTGRAVRASTSPAW